MASTIPRARRKQIADAFASMNFKRAFFVDLTGYDPLTATTYTALIATATEVSGGGYTTGGYALTNKLSANLATNAAKMTPDPTSVNSATFTARYAVIYNADDDTIWGVQDFLSTYSVSSGTFTVTDSPTEGMFLVE